MSASASRAGPTDSEREREVIDVDDLDVFCTGVRHCVRIDRPPSPRRPKRLRDPVPIALPDSDSEDTRPAASPAPGHTSDPQHSSRSLQHPTELQRITQMDLTSRRALSHPRPTKKRATDALKMAADAINRRELKRKERVPKVIEISSDSESEIGPAKRQRTEDHFDPPHPSIGSNDPSDILHADSTHRDSIPGCSDDDDEDEDDYYTNFLASLDISNDANWVPLPERNKAEDLTPVHELDNYMSKPHPLPPLNLPRQNPRHDQRNLPIDWASVGLWGVIRRKYGITKFPKPFYHARRQESIRRCRPPNLFYEQGYNKLALTAKYPHLASGSVNKIVQAQDTIVLCAVVEGGLEESDDDDDAEDRPPPPENKLGSLVVFHRGRLHVAPAHCRLRNTSRGSIMKYYTVNDVVFNPRNPRQFLSSGHDLVVQTWEILDDDDGNERNTLNAMRQIVFDSRPQDLVYNSDGSALAVTCFDGTVRLYSRDIFEDTTGVSKKFYAAPRGSGHATGSTLWGAEFSKHLLFTSSEPEGRDDYSGFHHAFDTIKGVQAFRLDAAEAGDAAALSPDGTTLVLFTRAANNKHPVRLYDVRRRKNEAYETEELEQFHVRPAVGPHQESGDTEEVNQASFSPDGLLLAVARNDNALHIYDVRALSRGPFCLFEHHESDSVGGGGFGVVAVNWIQGRDRFGIMSGGNDGCVRLWEPALGSRNEFQGAVMGRTDFDVGHFSVGDRQKGQLPLVIGDSGGGVHTYDFTNSEGIRI